MKKIFIYENSGKKVTEVLYNFTNDFMKGGENYKVLNYTFDTEKPIKTDLKFSNIGQCFFTKKEKIKNIQQKIYNKIHDLKKLEKDLSKKVILHDNIHLSFFNKKAKIKLGVCSDSCFFNFGFFNGLKITNLKFKKKYTFRKNFPNFIVNEIKLPKHKIELTQLNLILSNLNYLTITYKWKKYQINK